MCSACPNYEDPEDEEELDGDLTDEQIDTLIEKVLEDTSEAEDAA